MKNIIRKITDFFKTVIRAINFRQFAIPDPVLYFAAMFLFSALIMALETTYFHLLLIVSSYLKATLIISIAMLGIALGSFLGFYLKRINYKIVLMLSSVLVFISIILSYFNIISIGSIKYPYLLVLPFIFSSIIISIIFTRGHSTRIYFTNLLASACGVITPIFAVELLKSENFMILLLLVPVLFIIITALSIRENFTKTMILILSVALCIKVIGVFETNLKIPNKIPTAIFETKILPELGTGNEKEYTVNMINTFFTRVYTKDESSNSYIFSGDDYDKKRVQYFLRVGGYMKRFGIGAIPFMEHRSQIRDMSKLPAGFFDNELMPALRQQYTHQFKENDDRHFIDRVYKKNSGGTDYELSGDAYDRLRAKYLLSQLGHIETIDINFDVRLHPSIRDNYKWYGTDPRILLSEDSMLGRVEYLGDEISTDMSENGTILDIMTDSSGPYWDPRMPHLKDPKIFIVGLSADGVAKSGTILENAKVSGIEINPTILRTMSDEGQFSKRAHYPYRGIDVHFGEGRSFLENSKEKYDIITLMNIHTEYGPLCSLGPEYFHTVEGTQVLLNKLTDRGYVTYEEIILNDRSRFFFLKLINTAKEAMRLNGITDPEKYMHVFSWDFSPGQSVFRTLTLKRTPFTEEELRYYNGEYIGQLQSKDYYYNVKIEYSPLLKTGSSIEKFILDPQSLSHEWIPNFMRPDEFLNGLVANASSFNDKATLLHTYRFNGDNVYYAPVQSFSPKQSQDIHQILQRAGYPNGIDLRPATDDSPFPYDVFNVKKEVWDILSVVMKCSLVLFIPILFLIIYRFGDHGKPLLWQFLFAASTGFGYMLVEIVLMQKFQRFIGSPMYSLIVVLGGLLFFSGVGSFVSHYFSKKIQIILVAFIPVFLVLGLFFLDGIFLHLAELSFNGKLIASALLILPITFLMGIPFPNALDVIKRTTSPEYGSLLFGISGAFATLGSASSILFTVSYGFRMTFVIGMICYFIGIAIFAKIVYHD
jgi:hypothetical protein